MVNLYTLPKEIHALIASYLHDKSGNLMRILANGIIIKTTINGCTYANGLLHSFDDEPIIATNDTIGIVFDVSNIWMDPNDKIWFAHGMVHRNGDLPALITGGCKIWYRRNKIHRDNDLPAIIHTSGTKYWIINGKCHRDNDKPAIEDISGERRWYQHDMLHRDNDLPAYMSDTCRTWYINHKKHRDNDLPAYIDTEGNAIYYRHGKKHRDNGPAVIRLDGIEYYRHGIRHNDYGPAVITVNGSTLYYKNNVLTAINYNDADALYYIDGVLMSKLVSRHTLRFKKIIFSIAGFVLGVVIGEMAVEWFN